MNDNPTPNQILNDMVFDTERWTVTITRAMRRRIDAYAERLMATGNFDDDPIELPRDMSETIGGLLDQALEDSERDAGLYSTLDGHVFTLPRPRRRSRYERLNRRITRGAKLFIRELRRR